MLTSADARRRWFGTFFLILAGGMLVWGLTFLASPLLRHPLAFVIYWIVCFGLTLFSLIIAFYDMTVMRRRVRQEKKSAFERAFSDVVAEEKKRL